MNKYFTIFLLYFTVVSCAYPDIDNVPDFKDTKLTDDELLEFCNISNTDKKDIDKCINGYKS